MNNKTGKKSLLAKVFSGIFAGFMVLSGIFTFTIRRDADPKYPELWLEYKNNKIRIDYPNTWNFDSSIKTEDYFKGVPEDTENDLETLIFELKNTNCAIVINIIPKIEKDVLMVMYPDTEFNTAVKKAHKKDKMYEYLNNKLDKYAVVIRGYYMDDRGAEDMQKIIQHMGEDLRSGE